MKRKIYDKLIDWEKNDSRRTALLIDGARRVGKSYIAEEFAKSEYKSHLIIDFNRAGNDLKDIFERYLDDLDTFFTYLSAYYGIRLYERESLIIFDEVQMLRTAGHDLYFYSNSNREDASERMEIDFLVAKSKVTSRHNVSPIEVKSGKKYALTSMRKFIKKFGEQLHTPYVLHSSDLRKSEGIVYLPLYMAGLL